MSSYKLSYFNLRGLGELPRMLFAAAGVKYEDHRYPFSVVDGAYVKPEFDADKAAGKFPQGQVPVLTVTKGDSVTEICQSKAIVRYIASNHGLMGSTPEEAAIVDSVFELVQDVKAKYDSEKGDAVKLAAFFATYLPEKLQVLARFCAKYGGGEWFACNKVSLAEIVFARTFADVGLGSDPALPVAMAAVPSVQAVLDRTLALPGLAAWIAERPASMF